MSHIRMAGMQVASPVHTLLRFQDTCYSSQVTDEEQTLLRFRDTCYSSQEVTDEEHAHYEWEKWE